MVDLSEVSEAVLKHRMRSKQYRKDNPDYQNKYMKENIKQLNINLSRTKDADIIEYIESLPRGQKDPYIKSLIRKDMAAK